jgi:LacI family transcriptional regulator
VINDSPLVNPETKKQVMKAIKELGYAPNMIARSLTTRKTYTLAVTLPDIAGGVFPEILAGIDEVACAKDYHLLVAFMGRGRAEGSAVDNFVRKRQADAMVAVATVDDNRLRELADLDLPIVRAAKISPVPEVIPSVLYDNRGGARDATKLLIERGCRRIVNVRGPIGTYDAEQRSQGYRDALEQQGLPFDPALEVEGTFLRDSGRAGIQHIVDQGLAFDGVFAGNDEMAIGVMEVLKERGIQVPDQVKVVGFDDIDVAHFIGLSTVSVPIRDMGRTAAELAFRKLQVGQVEERNVFLPTQVVERSSTGG